MHIAGGEDTGLFRMGEEPVDESPSSMSTGDKGIIMGESGRVFSNDRSSTLMVSFVSFELTVIVLTVARSGRDWVWTICIRRGDMAGDVGRSSLSSFQTVVALGLSGFLGGTDGG